MKACLKLAQVRPNNYTGPRCGGSKAAVHGNKTGVVVQPDHGQNMMSYLFLMSEKDGCLCF